MRIFLALIFVFSGLLPAQEPTADDLERLRTSPTIESADATAARLRRQPESLITLIELLGRSKVWTDRWLAARMLGWADADSVATTGLERLALHRDGAWPVREQFLLSIADGDGRVALAVSEGLEDDIARVRLAAVHAAALLATSGEKLTSDDLLMGVVDATRDPSSDIRRAATSALMAWSGRSDLLVLDTFRAALQRDLPRRIAREVGAALLLGGRRSQGAQASAGARATAVYADLLRLHDFIQGESLADAATFDQALAFLSDGEVRSTVGGELADRLLVRLAHEERHGVRAITAAASSPESREVISLALAASSDVPWPAHALRVAMLQDVLWGRDPVETALDELAVVAEPAHAEALEAFCLTESADDDVRRVALRILFELDVELSSGLKDWLRRAERPRLAAEYAEQRWLRGDDATRRQVVADVRRWFEEPRHERLATGVLSKLCRHPRAELGGLLRARLFEGALRSRGTLVDALAQLGDEESIGALRFLLAATDDMSLVRRIERHLIEAGDGAVVAEVLARATADEENWRAASLEDLVTLRDVNEDSVFAMAKARLDGRFFDDRSLGHLIEIVRRRHGRKEALEHLALILKRAAGGDTWPGPERIPLSGNVLGGLLESLDASELTLQALACVRTGRVAQVESLLEAVSAVGAKDREALARGLLEIWNALSDGVADVELRAALLDPLMAHAGKQGREIVAEALRSGLAAFYAEVRHRELYAELAARAAGVLVRRGGAAEASTVMEAVAETRDDELVSVLLWSFTESPDVAAMERALAMYVRATGVLPEATLQAWVEGAISSRHAGHPLGFIAEVVLDRPLQRAVASTRGLMGMALRLADRGDEASRTLALRLVQRARRLARLRPRRRKGSLRVDYPTPRELEWLALALGADIPSIGRWARRIDVERVMAYTDRNDVVETALRACGSGLRTAEVLRAQLRRRLDDEPALVLEGARRLSRASRVIPAGSPIHSRPAFDILQAAALWRLDRRDEAYDILRRHGWPRARRLPELTRAAFPGL